MTVDRNIKILLVEDSDITRKMEIKIIKDAGFTEVAEAIDGTAAVKVLETDQPYDLIISDWNMPNMDGLELLKWVRANQARKDVPFIMATAQGEKKQIKMAQEAGVSSLVPKPFSPADLDKAITQAFAPKDEAAEDSGQKKRSLYRLADGRVQMKIAHIQITDHLVLGVTKHLIETGHFKPQHFDLATVCMPGWNPVVEALENGEIDGALILAPIAMDLFNFGTPIKLVLLAHKNGSIFVRAKRSSGESAAERFRGKTFYIPHRLSIHNMLAHMYLSEMGLEPGVPGQGGANIAFEVVPPIKMPGFLAENEDSAGFMVAEPLGTKAIAGGAAELEFLSSEAWQDHPCCVVVLREEMINEAPEAVQEYIGMLVEAGRFIETKPDTAAEVAVGFLDPQGQLGLTKQVLKNVLTEPAGITTDDLFPVKADLEKVQQYMTEKMGIGSPCNVDEFCDLRFAEKACGAQGGQSGKSKLQTLDGMLSRVETARTADRNTKMMLDKEGKYLCLIAAGLDFGVKVLKTREIIGLAPITKVPRVPSFLKGVINLRGKVIPVVDLRLALDLPAEGYTERTCIIVVEVDTDKGQVQMGVIVDAVSEVINITAAEMEPPPSFGTGLDSDYLLAMAKQESRVRMLLDIDVIVQGIVNQLEHRS